MRGKRRNLARPCPTLWVEDFKEEACLSLPLADFSPPASLLSAPAPSLLRFALNSEASELTQGNRALFSLPKRQLCP